MSDQMTPEQLLDELDSQIADMQQSVSFTQKKQQLADLTNRVGSLSHQLDELRGRGYRYKSYLEGKIATIKSKWATARTAMQREIDRAERDLTSDFETVADKSSALQRLSGSKLSGEVASLESKVAQLESKITSANSAIDAAVSGIQGTLYQTEAQLRQADWCLDELDAASFELLVGENPIQAVKAKWWRDGKNKGPEGNLYLTDQRLVFEQKEEVATKKVLFVATEKETVQEMLFEANVGAIEECKSSSKGMFGHEDHLDFTFGSGVDYGNAHFHIDGQDSDFWASLVKRVLNGEIMTERFYAEGEEAQDVQASLEENLAAAPEKCSACGAPFEEMLTRGQRQLQCEYCGNSMRW